MKKRILIMAIVLLISILSFAEKTIDRKIAALEEKLQDVSGKEKVTVLNELALLYRYESPGKCIESSSRSLKLAKRMGYKQGEGAALKNIGIVYLDLKNYDKAFEYLQGALNIFEMIGDKKSTADSLKAIGVIYWIRFQYDTALKFYFRSLKIAEEIGDKPGTLGSAGNIGIIYTILKNHNKALEYHQKALKISKDIGDKIAISKCLIHIGTVYHDLVRYDEALESYTKAWEIAEEMGDKRRIAASLGNIGNVHEQLGNYNKALEYYQKTLKIGKEIGEKSGGAICLNNIGNVYIKLQDYKRAFFYLEQCLKVAKETKSKRIIRDNYKNFSSLYELKKDYKKALEYYKLYFEVNEEIFNEKTSKQITDMQTRYETEKKEKEIEILAKGNEIQKLQLSRERATRNAFIVSFILVSIILVLLFRKYLYLFAFWKKEKYISQFRLLEKIDTGGMGIIYKGHHIKNKSEILAIKVLREELTRDEDIIKRFKQEATIIDRLDHPNIVKIFERGQFKQRFFIAMEFLAGKTLEEKITTEEQFDLKECFHIMIQVADVLTLIHSKNIIHRDLKPSNIMLIKQNGAENFVKLLDFGVARTKFQTRITKTGIMVGTTSYLSPEQITHSGVSPASDVFSLGIFFYEMVCGRKPFAGESESDIIKGILHKTPVEPGRFRPDVPDRLNELIMTMLAKRKKPRPTSQEILEVLKKINKNPQIEKNKGGPVNY